MAFQSFKLFALELDGPDNTVYSSGEMITGVVVLELNREIKVRAMRVLGRGVATAHWLENRSVGVNTVYNDYTSKTTYFRKRRHLIRGGFAWIYPLTRYLKVWFTQKLKTRLSCLFIYLFFICATQKEKLSFYELKINGN